MAKDWNVWIDLKGVADNVLNADFMAEAVKAEAEKIRNRCGDGYEVDTTRGNKRATARVYPATNRARRDNLENNTLLKAAKSNG